MLLIRQKDNNRREQNVAGKRKCQDVERVYEKFLASLSEDVAGHREEKLARHDARLKSAESRIVFTRELKLSQLPQT